jgi:AcrR family transcriptional regulator
MRRTKEDADITRQKLLEAALRVFSDKGFAATRLSDIGEAAGVTRGAIYWHFGNKKELFITLFREQMDPFFELIKNILHEDTTPLTKIEKVMHSFFEKLKKDRDFLAHQHLDSMEKQTRVEIPEIYDCMQARRKKFSQILIKIIKDGVDAGEIRKEIEPEAVTSMIATMVAGYGFLIGREEKRPLFKRKGKEMIEIFIKGIRA